MIDNEDLSPLGACRLWGINKYAQESACDWECDGGDWQGIFACPRG